MRGRCNRLAVEQLAIIDDEIVARSAETIFGEERVASQASKLRNGRRESNFTIRARNSAEFSSHKFFDRIASSDPAWSAIVR